MTSLDSYLRGTYQEDNAFLERLSNTIQEVIPVFYRRTSPRQKPNEVTWPYAVRDQSNAEVKPSDKHFSASTHCMILFALYAFTSRGSNAYSFSLGEGFQPLKLAGTDVKMDELLEVIRKAKMTLITELKSGGSNGTLVKSTTYGNNDPFTLTWLMELVLRVRPSDLGPQVDDLDECRSKIRAAVESALGRRDEILATEDLTGRFTEVSSSFLQMRRLRLAQTATNIGCDLSSHTKKKLNEMASTYWRDFDATIHRQLSYNAMSDSRFDPAELAFAFEGALLLHPTWVIDTTVDQVFEALQLSENNQPYWRPLTPFLANNRGHVVFLISIEVANSILRSCEILDRDDTRPTRFSQIERHLRTYATWLLGEVEEISDFEPRNPKLIGWRTEYEDRAHRRGTIHLWYTSHVLVFLAHYHSLLRRKIGAEGVEAAGLQVSYKRKASMQFWRDEPLHSLVSEDEKQYAVLDRIEHQYIKLRENPRDGRQASRSMLLYGPPGTGKTTLAEQLAARLKRPLITVTVSDFLAAGAAEIENRAKGVFEVLRSQEDKIILFDEIDQFLLDRNSKLYQDQSDVFKFMTPGMLTKLQDLRDAESSIFIIATNYYERVDSAIKRRGRIDDRFLLCVPDQKRRRSLLERFVLELFTRELEDEKTRKEYEEAVGEDDAKRRFLDDITGYRDLRVDDVEDPTSLVGKLREGEDPLSRHLRESFSPETREQLAENGDGPPPKLLQVAVVDELNRLSRGMSLYEERRFEGVELPKEIRKLARKSPQGEQIIYLNRALLDIAYSHEIERRGFEETEFDKALRERGVFEKTALYSWGDLKNLVEQNTKIRPGMKIECLAEALANASKLVDTAVSLSAYRNRFDELRNTFPIEEFFLLLYLVGECSDKTGKKKFASSERRVIEGILAQIRTLYGNDFELLVDQQLITNEKIKEAAREVWNVFPPEEAESNSGEPITE